MHLPILMMSGKAFVTLACLTRMQKTSIMNHLMNTFFCLMTPAASIFWQLYRIGRYTIIYDYYVSQCYRSRDWLSNWVVDGWTAASAAAAAPAEHSCVLIKFRPEQIIEFLIYEANNFVTPIIYKRIKLNFDAESLLLKHAFSFFNPPF